MINNTPVAVTMQSCPGDAADTQQCSAAVKIAPNGTAEFPLSSPSPGSGMIMVITGYQAGPRCLMVPTTDLPDDATADVTDANSGNCTGPFGGLVPSA